MISDSVSGRYLVNRVSLNVVRQIAPEELDIYPELAKDYFENPTPPVLSESSADDELAFGFEELLIPVSHAVLAAVNVVLGYIVTEILKQTTNEISTALQDKIKTLFEVDTINEDTQALALTKDELDLVKMMARKQARLFGLDSIESDKLADALVGSLATI